VVAEPASITLPEMKAGDVYHGEFTLTNYGLIRAEHIAFSTPPEDPYFAYSAKGGGECSNAPTPAAIRNAVFNAAGIWLNDLPITPDKVIRAIREKKKR